MFAGFAGEALIKELSSVIAELKPFQSPKGNLKIAQRLDARCNTGSNGFAAFCADGCWAHYLVLLKQACPDLGSCLCVSEMEM